MATVPPIKTRSKNDYPTSDGKPLAETDWHRDLMNLLIETLKRHYESQDRIYVSGNLLLFYEPGNRRRHVSPDVFVVKGVPSHARPNYLMWEEGKGPDVVIEITSSSTRREDQETKLRLYRDTLRVKEYFLFDPDGDYLDPPLQGYRLRGGQYQKIRAVQDRLPSRMLELHLEPNGSNLRLYDPAAEDWLLTEKELANRGANAEAEIQRRIQAVLQVSREQYEALRKAFRDSQAAREQELAQRQRIEEENERLRQELEELRRRPPREP